MNEGMEERLNKYLQHSCMSNVIIMKRQEEAGKFSFWRIWLKANEQANESQHKELNSLEEDESFSFHFMLCVSYVKAEKVRKLSLFWMKPTKL